MALGKRDLDQAVKRIERLIKKWHVPLGMNNWRLQYTYLEEDPARDADEWEEAAYTSCRWEYLEAQIAFNLKACHSLSDHELEEVFVHECCHALVSEMRAMYKNPQSPNRQEVAHEERVVVQLARAFINCRDAGCKLNRISVE